MDLIPRGPREELMQVPVAYNQPSLQPQSATIMSQKVHCKVRKTVCWEEEAALTGTILSRVGEEGAFSNRI